MALTPGTLLSICGSPAPVSRTTHLLHHVGARLGLHGYAVVPLRVRALPAEALLYRDTEHPAISCVVDLLADAEGVVIGTPVYKAAYTGILKSLIDALPQNALAGKAILPLATGGSPAHTLAIDYALRPVLGSMGAGHIAAGRFILDRMVTLHADGTASIDYETEQVLTRVADDFAAVLRSRPRPPVTQQPRSSPTAARPANSLPPNG